MTEEQKTSNVLLHYSADSSALVGIQVIGGEDQIDLCAIGAGCRDAITTTGDVPNAIIAKTVRLLKEIMDSPCPVEFRDRLLMTQMELHPYLHEDFRYQFETVFFSTIRCGGVRAVLPNGQ